LCLNFKKNEGEKNTRTKFDVTDSDSESKYIENTKHTDKR